jgi:Dit-like phage tail protein
VSSGQYTPPQWGHTPAQVSITVPPQPGTTVPVSTATLSPTAAGESITSGLDTVSLNPGGGTTETALSQGTYTVYVFDAVLDLEHEQALETTNHPVQTGADINSHAYLMPARLSMSVGMSDVMTAFQGQNTQGITASLFTGGATKSVSAYQTMLTLQSQRALLTITTRIRTYVNMLVANIAPREDFRTVTGLRMRIDFRQVLTGSASTTPLTARSDATQTSGLGQVQPQVVPPATQSQFGLPVSTSSPAESFTTPGTDQPTQNLLNYINSGQTVHAPGTGSYSSCPLTCLANQPVPR